eukprot:CAMPEP_0184974204 /NCGR_PEP_ID=MMETSP1098-20130426/5745_1 /TAXON_ID=89044 /ORGANISM="Spumella elongata, Strain CCAP 955/1" /LENGTH=858 /DNA_ID=CAMNT_0027496747 /DNA_START=70 /DNA_END=2646 /DNA_ORIENTATION=+
MEPIDSKVETLTNTILKTDAESWEIRNKAILQLTDLVSRFKDEPDEIINEHLTANIFRMLKEPVKNMILDLRSQQVRDTCQFLMKLSDIAGDRMKPFLRDSFSTVLEGVKIPHKVTSGYIDECIVHLIKRVTFKSAIILFMHEIKDSKSKILRERCLEYVNLILMHWDMTEKELDFFVEAIKIGLEDAGVRAREIARAAYMNMFNLYPEKAEKIKSLLPKAYQQKLTRSEEEGLSEGPSSPGSNSATLGSSFGGSSMLKMPINLSSTSDSIILTTSSEEIASAPATFNRSTELSHSQKSTASAPAKPSAPHAAVQRSASQSLRAAAPATPAAPTPAATVSTGLQNADVIPVPSKKRIVPPKTQQPSSSEALSSKFEKMASLNSINLLSKSLSTDSTRDTWGKSEMNRGSLDSQLTTSTVNGGMGHAEAPTPSSNGRTVESSVEHAVASLQARVRGTLSRRRSIVHNPFAALASSPPPATQSASSSGAAAAAGQLTSTGNSNSSHSLLSGITTHSTKSSNSSNAGGVSFASSTKAHSSATNSSLRTPMSKRPATTQSSGLRGAPGSQPAFCTRTVTAAPTPAPASVRKATSTGSQDNARSTSVNRSPRAASVAVISAPTPARPRSANKTRPTGTTGVSSPEKTASVRPTLNENGSSEVAQPPTQTVLFPTELSLNMRVYVISVKDNSKLAGTIRFIGHTSFSAGIWIGVCLDTAQGKNDGSVQGRRYFDCAPEHGLFVKEDVVERILSTSDDRSHAVNEQGKEKDKDSSSVTSLETPSFDSAEKKGTVTGLLKLKLSQMMELLNRQLEIVVELEEEDHKRGSFSHSKRALDLQAEVVVITNQEQNLINSFKQCLHDRLG